jgi:ribosomal protein S27E
VNIAPLAIPCPNCLVPQVVCGTSLAGQEWVECLACGWQAVLAQAPRRPS